MNSIWLSLLWKEWCEQRWKMAALAGVLLATPAISLFVVARASRNDLAESALEISTTVLFPYALLAGMLVGMSVAAGENSRRTSRFLSALPGAAWKAGAAKILVAVLVVSLPVVILWSLTWLFVTNQTSDSFSRAVVQNIQEFKLPWSISSVFFARCVGGVLGVVSVLLWCVVCGMNRADEVRAGALAFLGGSAAWLVFAGLSAIAGKYHFEMFSDLMLCSMPALPGGPGLVNSHIIHSAEYRGISSLVLASVALLGHAALCILYLKSCGRVASQKARVNGELRVLSKLRLPELAFNSPATAITWKQLRELGPLVAFAVVGIIVLVPLIHWWDKLQGGLAGFGEMLAAVTLSVAALVALVAGIGVLYEDYAPGIENFWRSRPINLHLWFWIKYVTGLAVLTICFGSLLVFAIWLEDWPDGSIATFKFVTLFFPLLYVLALAAYAVVRQPIYAIVLAIAALFSGWLCLVWMSPHGPPRWLNGWGAYPVVLTIVAVISAFAWQTVVRNWGWKQSR